MKNFLLLLLLFVMISCQKRMLVEMGNDDPPPPAITSPIDGYNLSWSDEFDGTTVDTTEWKFRTWETAWLGNVPSIGRKDNVLLDSGKLKILHKIEHYVDPATNKSYEVTAGGVQSVREFKFGYYEASVKLSSKQGWHESFWTFWYNDINPATYFPGWDTTVRTEIDIFEHPKDYNTKTFTYGIYKHTGSGANANMVSLQRDIYTGDADLSNQFNTFGMEYTSDYINYFFNGQLIKTVDARKINHRNFYVWLSVVGNGMPEGNGEMQVDYFRYFAPDESSTAYQQRRASFLQLLNDRVGDTASNGTDLWVQVEDFKDKGGWTVANDDNVVVLSGHSAAVSNESERYARTGIKVQTPGTYKLWVRCKDYKNNLPGKRNFQVFINGAFNAQKFGTHGGDELYEWQDGGTVVLNTGVNEIELYDLSMYYAKCDKLLLTTDQNFVPSGYGGESNVEHVAVDPDPPAVEAKVWIEAEDFPIKGSWTRTADGSITVLRGRSDHIPPPNESDRTAKAVFEIQYPGEYKLWVRSKDYWNNLPGSRYFDVKVQGVTANKRFGTHGSTQLYDWQDGGIFTLPAGDVTVEIYDTSLYYASCDKVLLTNLLGFVPQNTGDSTNVTVH